MKQNENFIGWQIIWWLFTILGIPITLPWLIYNLHDIIMYKRRKAILRGKIVMITGASSGLGEALAHVFYSCGCRLILISRRKQELQRVKDALLNTHHTVPTQVPVILPLDLTEINSLPVEVAKVLKMYGRIDILINNAGISYRGEVIDTKVDVDIKVMLINYFSQVALTKAVLPWMVKQNFGYIVYTSSIQGKVAIPFRSAYAASKHALQAWCDSARAELSTKNIKMTIVNPGYIHTALSLNALTSNGQQYGIMDKTTKNGYSPKYIAIKVLKAMLREDKEITIATFTQKIAILLRVLLPSVYFWIMQLRVKNFLKNK
ncbi:dehydrogenase/reductase SDR family protein 7-like [Nasonia vitripennis]|uniref:Ketoreductase domain-containing protein n=1 Tax=Nasonia vitripennis TaxID=7425 RepID=A0A7M7R4N7_NASVI|nr:dehydrogenase/reductase SDR family protein 7-like [Nasonia vitripennis]XP_016842911.1 dehydrogenase/reductase SDR family protein 7-like [Nasonia vitripennis]XP_016842913.1 dehydrogenase/reductase SDR family protein 7-like [Nasonia vitripennis]XP_032457480.1 dehydrogenase/reductase SDR family protein 7-like [Nasonia vitripennis]